MSSPALTSSLVAVRPRLRDQDAAGAESVRGSVLVLGGVESAVEFCQATGASGNGAASQMTEGDGFLPIAIALSGNGNGHAHARGNGNGNGRRAEGASYAAWELTAERLRQLVEEQHISQVVVVDPEIERHQELVDVLLDCRGRGVQVWDSEAMYEELFHKVRLESLTPRSVLYGAQPALSGAYRKIKRALDAILGAVLLALASPVMALAAAAIRLESRGPVLFRQERVGLRGKTFHILKLRSMREDAEKAGPQWAQAEDDRVTRVGAFLRRHHLDELPQLINVLRGDMSLVGPRPERPCFVEVLRDRIPYYDLRHHVKPGITGWAQVEYEYGDSVEDAWEKLQYDLYYTRNASLRLDLLILLKTVRAVLSADGR